MNGSKYFYKVISRYYGSGKVSASYAGKFKCTTKPETEFSQDDYSDIYIDWFDDIISAFDFVRDAQNA